VIGATVFDTVTQPDSPGDDVVSEDDMHEHEDDFHADGEIDKENPELTHADENAENKSSQNLSNENKGTLMSRVRSVLPILRLSTRVAPQAATSDPATDKTVKTPSKGMRMKRAVKRIQIVKGLASHAILNRIREERAHSHNSVLTSLSTLLSSDKTTSELARLSFEPEQLRREVARLQQTQKANEEAEAAKARASRGRRQDRRLSVEEYLLRSQAEALREREAHRALLGFGKTKEDFMHSVELLGSKTQLNQARAVCVCVCACAHARVRVRARGPLTCVRETDRHRRGEGESASRRENQCISMIV
jgi:hypothetical protein